MDRVIHRLDTSQAIVTVGPVIIRVITSAVAKMSDLDFLAERLEDVLARYPAGGVWVIVHHGAPIPDGPTRRHAGRVFKPFNDRMCLAYSMLGLGFWSSAAIAATKMLSRLIGANAPITTSVEEGALRLSLDLVGIDPDVLISTHDDLLAQMSERAA